MFIRNKIKGLILLALTTVSNITNYVVGMGLSKLQEPITSDKTFHFEYGGHAVIIPRDETVIAADGCALEVSIDLSHEFFTANQICDTTSIQLKLLDEQVKQNTYLASSVENGEIRLLQPNLSKTNNPVKALSFNTVPGVYRRIYDDKVSENQNTSQTQKKSTQPDYKIDDKASAKPQPQPTTQHFDCEMDVHETRYANGGAIHSIHKGLKEYKTEQSESITCTSNSRECVVDYNPNKVKAFWGKRHVAAPKQASIATVFNERSEAFINCRTNYKR